MQSREMIWRVDFSHLSVSEQTLNCCLEEPLNVEELAPDPIRGSTFKSLPPTRSGVQRPLPPARNVEPGTKSELGRDRKRSHRICGR